jgi:two-component system CheB/CheR fusion protein
MDELRRQAEQRLRSQKVRPVEGMTEAEARALVHELQVHQIELEMLKAAKDAAEQANRAKDRFLAVLSHELRTPLTPVVMGLSMLQDRLDLDPPLREMLEMVRRNVEFEARLIDDLLDVSRIAQGKVELTRSAVDLSTVIQRAIEVCKAGIQERGLHLGVEMGAAGPYWVEADVPRLQQVFWNLLQNAIKVTPRGGCVGIRCGPSEAHVLIEVCDSGIGIEPESLARIFQAFEQAERSITRKFGGLGLGLAISRALVELHGGQIEAHSAGLGKGATFRVRLPLTAPPEVLVAGKPVEASERAASEAGAVRPLRILLVEDHPVTSELLRKVLTSDGHAVETAGDVATGLELAGRQTFDLLLSDLGLPDGSGYDLIRQLRQRGHAFPAIALSGYGQGDDLQRSHAAGFAAHLTKPASRRAVVEAVAAVAARTGTGRTGG